MAFCKMKIDYKFCKHFPILQCNRSDMAQSQYYIKYTMSCYPVNLLLCVAELLFFYMFTFVCCICDFQHKFSSRMTPTNFVSLTLLISIPFMLIEAPVSLFLLLNIMKSVLLRFNDNLFRSNHVFTLLSTCLIPELDFYKIHLSYLVALTRSLINKINSFGPRTEPWGTPHCMYCNSDLTLSVCTNCLLFPNNLLPIFVLSLWSRIS